MKIGPSISAVVTGGASGLGEATVRALAGRGARAAIFDLNQERGEAVAAEVGGVYCHVDVSDNDSVDAGFAKAATAHGPARILVNCAGTSVAAKTASRSKTDGSTKHFPLEGFDRVIQVNLIGTFRCVAKFAAQALTLEPLADGERAVIINTASVAAEDGQIGQAAYSASKGGIVGMTLPIARDLMDEGIRINTILPGLFATPPMLAGLDSKVVTALSAMVPFPKTPRAFPEEYADLVLMMVENGYFNGEDVRLDGAIRMAPR